MKVINTGPISFLYYFGISSFPARMTKTKKITDSKSVYRDMGKGEQSFTLVELQTDAAKKFMEISVVNLLKAKVHLPYNPAIICLGTCPVDLASYSTDTCLAMSTASLLTIARN